MSLVTCHLLPKVTFDICACSLGLSLNLTNFYRLSQESHCLSGPEGSVTNPTHQNPPLNHPLVLLLAPAVDYAHSENSATPLMLAAGRGNVEVVERLLSLGANPTQRASNDM